MGKYIVHIDMDAFFASVEQRDNPALRGKPVVVGADPKQGRGRGVVSTCSYEARSFGIRSAMPISKAYRLCPHAVFLPVAMERYGAASRRVFDILGSFSPQLEPVSIDEAYLDISSTYTIFGAVPRLACVKMKERIVRETGLTASVGLAPTKMAAKIASDLKKPDGLVEVQEDGIVEFLRPLPIGVIWGLGPKAEEKLHSLGIRTVGELAGRDPRELTGVFGASGMYFWQAARGIDEREVESGEEAKSISAENTFEHDSSDRRLVETELARLCEHVSRRMRHEGLRCATVTLKLRFSDFSTFTRSVSVPSPTNFVEELISEIMKLFRAFGAGERKLRLVGVKVSRFYSPDGQLTLFPDSPDRKKERVHEVVDKIKDKFGERSISRASTRHPPVRS